MICLGSGAGHESQWFPRFSFCGWRRLLGRTGHACVPDPRRRRVQSRQRRGRGSSAEASDAQGHAQYSTRANPSQTGQREHCIPRQRAASTEASPWSARRCCRSLLRREELRRGRSWRTDSSWSTGPGSSASSSNARRSRFGASVPGSLHVGGNRRLSTLARGAQEGREGRQRKSACAHLRS